MDDIPAHPDGEGDQHRGEPIPVRRLNIVVKDQNNEVHFAVKGNTKFKKIMDRFCENQGKNLSNVRFGIDGERIRPEQTPDDVSSAVRSIQEYPNKAL